MRARFIRSRGRVNARGRYLIPVSAAAAVALVAGTVVAVNPDHVDGDVALAQSMSQAGITGPSFAAGAEFSYSVKDLANAAGAGSAASMLDTVKPEITGLPAGVHYDVNTGLISGTPTTPGTYPVQINIGGFSYTVDVTITGAGESTTAGQAGGQVEGNGQMAGGSTANGNPLGVVIQGILTGLGVDKSTTGSLGGPTSTPPAPPAPSGTQTSGSVSVSTSASGAATVRASGEVTPPAGEQTKTTQVNNGSLADLTANAGSLAAPLAPPVAGSSGQAATSGTAQAPAPNSSTLPGGSLGQVTTSPVAPKPGETTGNGGLNTQSLGGFPGSTMPSGSTELLIPGLAIAGTLMLGLAALGALSTGSLMPGSTMPLSSGSTGKAPSGSSGSLAGPAAGQSSPKPQVAPSAPGPNVANGRG